jgi:hypothetical protein
MGGRRSMSSSADSEDKPKAPSMESKLRKLYMRVHPDLFSSHPEEKEVNTKSFQQLSEFLTTIKGDSAPETSTKSFPIKFFFRPARAEDEQEQQVDGEAEEEPGLESFEITLRAGGSVRDRIKQLSKLFKAVGLGEDVALPENVSPESRGPVWASGTIQVQLHEMSEEAKQRKAELALQMREVWARKHMLNLKYQVKVTTARCVPVEGAESACLDKLLDDDVLRWLHQQTGGGMMHCILSDRYGVDLSGGIMLDYRGTAAEWCKHIASVQSQDISKKRRMLKDVRDAEEAAARSVGLSYIHGEGHVEATQDYLQLLKTVHKRQSGAAAASTAGEGGGVEGGREGPREAKGATLLVKEEGGDWGGGCHVESVLGTMVAPVSADASHLIDFVMSNRYQVRFHSLEPTIWKCRFPVRP